MKVWWELYDGWWVVHIRGRLQVILLSQYHEGVHSYTCNAGVEGGTHSPPTVPRSKIQISAEDPYQYQYPC